MLLIICRRTVNKISDFDGHSMKLESFAGLGIEPKFSLSESDVLPLDDPAVLHLSVASKLYQILEILHLFLARELHLAWRQMWVETKAFDESKHQF